MKKKEEYLRPDLLVLELDPETRMMGTLSGGVGQGSDMLNPDLGQDPFSIIMF